MAMLFNFTNIISSLRKSGLVSKIEKTTVDEIAQRGFYKIKCQLIPSKYKLDIKFIKTQNEFIYSYQLYTTVSLVRWDNEPHFPGIKTFPHHFHDLNDEIMESNLTGAAEEDLEIVLSRIREIIGIR